MGVKTSLIIFVLTFWTGKSVDNCYSKHWLTTLLVYYAAKCFVWIDFPTEAVAISLYVLVVDCFFATFSGQSGYQTC